MIGVRSPSSVGVTAHFADALERVFDAWLDPEKVMKWMAVAGEKEGMGVLERVAIDARVGGVFSFVHRRDGKEIAQTGEYLEILGPGRLTFSWAMALPDIERVVIDIAPAETGCEVTLTHEMDPKWSGDVSPAEAAWTIVLDAIAETLEP